MSTGTMDSRPGKRASQLAYAGLWPFVIGAPLFGCFLGAAGVWRRSGAKDGWLILSTCPT